MTSATRFRVEEIGMPIGGYSRWGIYMNRNGKDMLVEHFATEQEAVDELDEIHGGRMKPSPKRIEKGEYWDEAWTLTRGCTHVSAGCDHCWSERMSHMRRLNPNRKVRDQYGMTDDSGHWTGKVETLPLNLGKPMRRKKPTMYAVWNDLFHEDVPWNFILDTFKTIAFCPQHTFLILTKRPERMNRVIVTIDHCTVNTFYNKPWPLPNVWLGTTVEDQEHDFRIRHLLRTPAAVRFISHEPALGKVDWGFFGTTPREWGYGYTAIKDHIDLIITGGETGPGARPMHPEWARNDRDQCVEAGVAFWLKNVDGRHGRLLDGRTWNEWPGEEG